MKDTARWPTLFLVCCAILIAASWALSRDAYKQDLHDWTSFLAETRLLSYDVTHDLLKLRGNFENNFDAITLNSRRLVDSISTRKSAMTAEPGFQWGLQRKIELDLSTLESLASSIVELTEEFKTDLSVFNNSKSVAFQLLSDMRSLIGRNNNQWQSFLNVVENRLIQQELSFQNFESQKLSDFVQQRTAGIKSRSKQQYLEYFLPHLRNIEIYNPKLEALVEHYLVAEGLLRYEVQRLGEQAHGVYQGQLARTRPASMALGSLVILSLVYGGFFAAKSIAQSRELQHYSRNLEGMVKSKTEDLEQAMRSLNEQVDVKRATLETLKEKEAQLAKREAFFRAITETAPDPILLVDRNLAIRFSNSATGKLFGAGPIGVTGQSFSVFLPGINSLDDLLALPGPDIKGQTLDGGSLDLAISVNTIELDEDETRYVCILHDLTGQKEMERELSQAQKLESVGQLAAGIAHEINTPAQFISDNLIFLQESIEELFDFIKECKGLAEAEDNDSAKDDLISAIDTADLDYLIEEVPSAINQSSDGIKRIATIVRAMKDYSHPGSSLELSDLNSALQSTITVSRGEWKYCADIETDFDEDLPLVPCVVSDINQVALNMIVNAAHAIEDRYSKTDDKCGKIRISTVVDGDHAVIRISDNGNGMPEDVKKRIFDPFFTTKKVGKGTGQGLSIAYKLIVDKHAGRVDVSSAPGEGTTFTIQLPLKQQDSGNSNDKLESAA